MFTVVVTEKGGSRQRLEFNKEAVFIGRVHGNDVVLPRGNVSKQHSKLQFENGEVVVSDLESTNGTYVNGRRIFNPQPVTDKDKIYVGDFILHVETGKGADKDKLYEGDTEKNLVLNALGSSAPVVSETSEVQSERKSRPSVPPPAQRMSDHPSEKRLPLPRPSTPSKAGAAPPRISKAVPPPTRKKKKAVAETPGDLPDDIAKTVQSLRSQVLDIVKLPTKKTAPAPLDPTTAAEVRAAVGGLLSTYAENPEWAMFKSPGALKGMVFRRIVDCGPLTAWLEDPQVTGIRITGPMKVSLRTDGRWVDVAQGFDSEEGLRRVSGCLGAGIDGADADTPGMKRFLSDEGFHVFTSTRAGAGTVIVDKTVAEGLLSGIEGIVGEPGLEVVKGAVDSEAKIAIVGKSPFARQLAYYQLLGLLPEQGFTVSVEPLPMSLGQRSSRLQLPFCNASRDGSGFSETLAHGLSLEPDWLAIGAVAARDTAEVLSAAAGRLALVADLPLSGLGRLDAELTTVMIGAGLSLSPKDAAALLDASFDIVIAAGRSQSGAVYIKRILASGLSDDGEWSPNALYSEDKTS